MMVIVIMLAVVICVTVLVVVLVAAQGALRHLMAACSAATACAPQLPGNLDTS